MSNFAYLPYVTMDQAATVTMPFWSDEWWWGRGHNWARSLDGYEPSKPAYPPTHPWPHCAKCDRRLRKVGALARCGREEVPAPYSKQNNPSPCDLCCATGRLVCFACCSRERRLDEGMCQRLDALDAEFSRQDQKRDDDAARRNEICSRFGGRDQFIAMVDLAQCQGFAYLIRAANGLVKIGSSRNPQQRFHTLKTMSPVALELVIVCPGGVVAEARLHEAFADHRSHGEWFREHPDMVRQFKLLTREATGKRRRHLLDAFERYCALGEDQQ